MPYDLFRSCLDQGRGETRRMSFLGLSGKSYLVVGFANKKSIAWAIAKTLERKAPGSFIPSATRRERPNLRKSSKTEPF